MSRGSKTSRNFESFRHKSAAYRISAGHYKDAEHAIRDARESLEAYILLYPVFLNSLVPIPAKPGAPEIAIKMHAAAEAAGVGPMAAVAGAIAEHAARAAASAGDTDVVVENGGDIFLICDRPAVVSFFAGTSPLAHSLAVYVQPEQTPLSICSSSGVMGHSQSFGKADLVTVCAPEAALADAVATALCNKVQTVDDIEAVLSEGESIDGVGGVLVVVGDRVGLVGDFPDLVRQDDAKAAGKITRS